MIRTKKELQMYMAADLIMNRGIKKNNFKQKIKNLISPDYIMAFLYAMRKSEYYSSQNGLFSKIKKYWYLRKKRKLSILLGFSISNNVFGYGLVIPHHGTIVVGGDNRIGNYCVLHTSICITTGNKTIGDGFYVSTGSKIINTVNLGDNVSIGANSLINHGNGENNCLIAGSPGKIIKESEAWYLRDGDEYLRRVELCNSII